jgi:low temperature requirement protein LtrA
VTPFNVASALLVIAAGASGGSTAAGYALWTAALAVQALSPLLVKPGGRFSIQPSHFVERHGALIIVAFGESVADIGIGAADKPVTASLITPAVLGLALAAALWWAYFGVGDDERAEEAMTQADPAARPALALNAYFYSYIPILLGIVAVAAGVKQAIGRAASTLPYPVCLSLAGGVALYLAGTVAFRRVLRIGTRRYRVAAAAAALAASAVGVTFSITAEIALLTAIVAAALTLESRSADPVPPLARLIELDLVSGSWWRGLSDRRGCGGRCSVRPGERGSPESLSWTEITLTGEATIHDNDEVAPGRGRRGEVAAYHCRGADSVGA